MSVLRSYFKRNNTIVYNSKINTGRNPVIELNFGSSNLSLDGSSFTRFRFDLDLTLLNEGIESGLISTECRGQLSHRLKMKNTSSFDITNDYRAFFGRPKLKFQYTHAADSSARLDPSATNIIDVYMLTRTYDTEYRRWIRQEISEKPLPPSSNEFRINFGNSLEKIKAISDEIIYHPVKYKELFGNSADLSLQATLKVVKSVDSKLSDSDIRVAVITAVNEFFSIENWEFGDTLHFAELSTYVLQKLSPNVANIVLVPNDQNLSFGSLYEIKSNPDEIFISSATVENIEIISELTAARLRTPSVISPVVNLNNGIQSR
jgi:hypothetical protein